MLSIHLPDKVTTSLFGMPPLAEHVFEAKILGLKVCDMSVTEGYQLNRRADAFAMAGLTDGLNTMFGSSLLPSHGCATQVLRLLIMPSPTKQKLQRKFMRTEAYLLRHVY